MKILFVQNTASISEGISGGEMRLYHVFRALRNKHDCTLTAFFGLQRMNAEFVFDQKIINRYTFYDRFTIYVALWLKCFDLLVRLMVSRVRYDIIYTASDIFPDVIPAFFYKVFHRQTKWVQCIFHIYPDWRQRPGNKLLNFIAQHLQKFTFSLIRRRADMIVVINNGVREELIRRGFRPQLVKFSPCGIDVPFLQRVKPSSRTFDGIFLSRLHPSKGVYDLVNIWKVVSAKHPQAKLGIIGSATPDVIEKVRQAIAAAGLTEKIDLLGFLSNAETFPLIKAAKVFLFPSHEEGWGMVVTEAMACGVPAVTWNLPVFDELYGGLVKTIPENDIQAFAEQVMLLLEDESMRRDLGHDVSEYVQRYSWSAMQQNEESLLLSLLNKNDGHRVNVIPTPERVLHDA